ncbi:nitrilase-related carbon-nitrogen hydrolase [Mucisphaera sp.]|uniref:nitrilase-related carbon-nitrogen hydrolase n=1 Tax=Mucisphaera sp. TaxID=2913024 RepID=UPI003D0AAE52
MHLSLAQIAPVLLNRSATTAKAAAYARQASEHGSQLVAFGETLIPGYPVWLEHTDAARFDSDTQKQLFALYLDQAVEIHPAPPEQTLARNPHLAPLLTVVAETAITIVLGVAERVAERRQPTP